MGYQETFRPIDHLAEAAGIREAIEAFEDCVEIPGYCHFYCATRSKEKFDEDGNPQLYVCVGGDRCVSMRIGQFALETPLDWIYSDHFEDLDDAVIDEAILERPDLAAAARAETEQRFKGLVEENRRWHAELDRQCEELRPIIAKYLSEHGPTRHQDMFKVKEFAGYSELRNVITQLMNEGLIVAKRTGRTRQLPLYELAQNAQI